MSTLEFSKLKILEVNKFYPPHVGGIEKMVQDLVKGFVGRGIQVRVLTCQPRRAPRRIMRRDGALVVYAASMGTIMSMPVSLDFFFLFLRLARWAEVVHWHEPFPLASLASLLCPIRGLSLVTWHSDIIRQRLLRPLVCFLQSLALRRADLIAPTSSRLALFSALVDEGSTKTHPVAIGMALDSITHVDAQAEENWVREHRPFSRYVLFVGRLVYYKGIKTLLAAAGQCRVPLVIIGQGPLNGWIRAEVDRLSLHGHVRLIEHPVDDEELALFYKHCEFLVLPSIAASEAFGMVQVEAMAFGKPVINTLLPTGVPTVSTHQVTGLTVSPSDAVALKEAIDTLWGDPSLCRKLGDAARDRAWTEFHRDKMVSQYMSLIGSRLLQRDAAPAGDPHWPAACA